jgi:UDP-2,3-diacylglucosamine pyrophosphatase LpxH
VAKRYRALFLSDFHLGSRHCQAERLWHFLKQNNADKIYLVGDIIEVSEMRHWPEFHHDIMEELFSKGANGTEVIYVPGNHDAIFRAHQGRYGNLSVEHYAYHVRAKGDILFVTHGDEKDRFRSHVLLQLLTMIERKLGHNYWETMRHFFSRTIRNHTIAFEARMVALAREHGYMGIICGHVHLPKITEGEVLYLNTGDWIYHCTAIAEHDSGKFEIIYG